MCIYCTSCFSAFVPVWVPLYTVSALHVLPSLITVTTVWRDILCYLLNQNQNQAADRSVSVPMTSTDLEGGTRGVKIFWRISIITPKQFDLERPGVVACFLGNSHVPSKGDVLASPPKKKKTIGDPLLRPAGLT